MSRHRSPRWPSWPSFWGPWALGHKDIRLTLAAAEDLRVPLPLASLLRDRFLTLLAHGGDKLDWSAIGRLAAKDADEVEGSGGAGRAGIAS